MFLEYVIPCYALFCRKNVLICMICIMLVALIYFILAQFRRQVMWAGHL